jgi:hypothetical protein
MGAPPREIVFRQIGGIDEALGFLVGGEAGDLFLFRAHDFSRCMQRALIGRRWTSPSMYLGVNDKDAAAFAVATCRAKPRFAFVGITDDARAIVAQNGLDFRDRHALRAFGSIAVVPNRTSWSCVHKCVCKINDGRKWSAGSLEIALLGRRVFRGQRFAPNI